jgi:hypothetical protein
MYLKLKADRERPYMLHAVGVSVMKETNWTLSFLMLLLTLSSLHICRCVPAYQLRAMKQ